MAKLAETNWDGLTRLGRNQGLQATSPLVTHSLRLPRKATFTPATEAEIYAQTGGPVSSGEGGNGNLAPENAEGQAYLNQHSGMDAGPANAAAAAAGPAHPAPDPGAEQYISSNLAMAGKMHGGHGRPSGSGTYKRGTYKGLTMEQARERARQEYSALANDQRQQWQEHAARVREAGAAGVPAPTGARSAQEKRSALDATSSPLRWDKIPRPRIGALDPRYGDSTIQGKPITLKGMGGYAPSRALADMGVMQPGYGTMR